MQRPEMKAGYCIVLAVLVGCFLATFQLNCPIHKRQWEIRAGEKNCSKNTKKTYHCIPSANSSFVEVCMVKARVQPSTEDCPWISFRDGEAIIGDPAKPCSCNGCPTKAHSGYFTDELYKYPGCITKNVKQSLYGHNTTVIDGGRETHCMPVDVTFWIILVCVLAAAIFVGALAGVCFYAHRGWILRLCNKEVQQHCPENVSLLQPALTKDLNLANESDKVEKSINEGEVSLKESERIVSVSNEGKDTFLVNGLLQSKEYIPLDVRKKLRDILEREGKALLCGISGSGKLAAAQWYGSLHQRNNGKSLTWKISSNSKDEIYQNLMELCNELKLFPANAMEGKIEDSDIMKLLREIKSELQQTETYVMIFENVEQNTENIVRSILGIIELWGNVKCIVTTRSQTVMANTSLFNESNTVDEFSFSELDVRKFFHSPTAENEEESNVRLAKYLSFYPSALKMARSYMGWTDITATKMLTLLKRKKRDGSESKANDLQMFEMIGKLLNIANEQEPRMYALLLHLRYFERTSIPLQVTNYIQPNSSTLDGDLEISRFVEFIKRFSFGRIHGKDDDRKVDLSPEIHSMLLRENDEGGSRRVTVLKAFALLMSKEHDRKEHRNRCMGLLPHAKVVLYHQEGNRSLLESLCIIMVSERLNSIYKTTGQKHSNRSQCSNSLRYCYELLESPFVNILETTGYELSQLSSVTLENKEDISRKIAEKIHKIIKKKVDNNSDEELIHFPVDYILRKFRHSHDRRNIKNVVPLAYEDGNILLIKEYEELKIKGHAVVAEPKELVKLFIFETFISSFLEYGVHDINTEAGEDDEDCEVRLLHVNIAYHLGRLLEEQFPQYPLSYVYYSEINGVMEVAMSKQLNKTKPKDKRIAELKEVENRLNTLLVSNKKYFYNGLCIRDERDPNRLIACREKLMKCCTNLEDLMQEEKDEYVKRTNLHAQEMERLLLGFEHKPQLAYRSQEMKQSLAEHFMERNEFQRAKRLLVSTGHVSYESTPETFISPKDMIDWELEAKCYLKLRLYTMLEHMNKCLQKRQANVDQDFVESNEQFQKLLQGVERRLAECKAVEIPGIQH